MYVYVHWRAYKVLCVIEGRGRFLPANVHVGEFLCRRRIPMCVYGILFPVRLCGSMEAKSIRQAGWQAGAAVGLLNVGSGLQGGSTQASLITAQMPLFIFRIVQLILVPVSEPLGKSDLLLPLRAVHVLSLTPSARQAFKTNFKANIVFIFTASRLEFLCFISTIELCVLNSIV